MNIVVINGSPNGDSSVTLRYVDYLRKHLPDLEAQLFEVARPIRRLESRPHELTPIADAMAAADGVIWSFPVYTFLIPGQLKRFIELLLEHQGGQPLGGVCTSVSTSAHFFDHTAHQYMEAVSADLGMKVVKGYSAGMHDLLHSRGQQGLLGFGRHFLRRIAGESPVEAGPTPVDWKPWRYRPKGVEQRPATGGRRIVLVHDARPEDHNLHAMMDVFERSVRGPVERMGLHELNIKGGCLGCLQCAADGVCVYKDDFAGSFQRLLLPADVIVNAGTIRDRYLSARWKTWLDRNFCNGHRPVLAGKPGGWLISGPLGQLPHLAEILDGLAEYHEHPRLGVVTDESRSSATVTRRIMAMADEVQRQLDDPWARPATFLGVGGQKVFRDLVYGTKGLMVADHQYYLDTNFYRYPNQRWTKRAINFAIGSGVRFKPTRKNMIRRVMKLRLSPYDKVLRDE